MDRTGRGIMVAIIAVLALAAAAITLSLSVPYAVRGSASLISLEGPATLENPGEPPRSLALAPAERLPIRARQVLWLDPGSQASLLLNLVNGRAVFTGPGALSILVSERRATTLDHVRGEGDYRLEIVQTGGTVMYYFDPDRLNLDQAEITIWTDHSMTTALRPSTPCWHVDFTGTEPILTTLDCS